MGTLSFTQITDSKPNETKPASESAPTEQAPQKARSSKTARKSVDDMAASLPSASKTRAEYLRGAPRVQFGFSGFPGPLKDEFDALAEERGMSKKALLFDALRLAGLDIPKGFVTDQRRRTASEWAEFREWQELREKGEI